jgi:hypothetical protein
MGTERIELVDWFIDGDAGVWADGCRGGSESEAELRYGEAVGDPTSDLDERLRTSR